MTDLTSLYYNLITGSFVYIIDQIIFLILFERNKAGWRFRPSRIKGHPNLRPLTGTFKIALGIFTISIIIIPIVAYLSYNPLVQYVKSMQDNFFILVSAFLGIIFMIWHYAIGKKLNKLQALFLISSLVCFVLPFYFTYVSTDH